MIWVIANLAQGAALTLTATISDSEHVGFKCSAKGLTILARLMTNDKSFSSASGLKVRIDGTDLKSSTTYMLETKPPFWAMDIDSPYGVLDRLPSNHSMTFTFAGQTFEVDLDPSKSTEYAKACKSLLSEHSQ